MSSISEALIKHKVPFSLGAARRPSSDRSWPAAAVPSAEAPDLSRPPSTRAAAAQRRRRLLTFGGLALATALLAVMALWSAGPAEPGAGRPAGTSQLAVAAAAVTVPVDAPTRIAAQPAEPTQATQSGAPAAVVQQTADEPAATPDPNQSLIAAALTRDSTPMPARTILNPVLKSMTGVVPITLPSAAAKVLPDSVPLAVSGGARPSVIPDTVALSAGSNLIPVDSISATKRAEGVIYESRPAENGAAPAAATHGSGDIQTALTPGGTDGDVGETLVVSGIFWDKQRPLALIGEKIVEVGSRIGKAEVVEIKPNSVTIVENGVRRVLHP
jgi:hypothetical protein